MAGIISATAEGARKPRSSLVIMVHMEDRSPKDRAGPGGRRDNAAQGRPFDRQEQQADSLLVTQKIEQWLENRQVAGWRASKRHGPWLSGDGELGWQRGNVECEG